MHGPICVFWANLTAFSLQTVAPRPGRLVSFTSGAENVHGVRPVRGPPDDSLLKTEVAEWAGLDPGAQRGALHAKSLVLRRGKSGLRAMAVDKALQAGAITKRQ